jgi:hypothetical protein
MPENRRIPNWIESRKSLEKTSGEHLAPADLQRISPDSIMTRHLALLLVFLLSLCPQARAEGVWRVKGHAFSNVHAWQRGTQVRVSGRVSGGPARAPFTAVVHVQGDDGKVHRVTIRKKRFSGQGETFEGHFKAPKRSRWWQVIQIEVVGSDPAKIPRSRPRRTDSALRPAASDATETPASGPARFFPIENVAAADMPTVRFSSGRPACVSVRERASGRLILMKNVTPDDSSTTPLPRGTYRAVIVGDGFTTTREFSVPAPDGVISLD